MRIGVLVSAWLCWLLAVTSAWGQFQQGGDPGGAELGESQTQRVQSGVIVRAVGGPCFGTTAYIPVPIDWPEQEVKIVEEDISPEAKVRYQTIDETVKLMIVSIPRLAAGKDAKAVATFEIRRSVILAPTDTGQFELPDSRKLDRRTRLYLGPSPLIESRDPRIRKLANEIGVDQQKAWDHVEAIYEWVREHVEYKNGPIKGALAALKDGTGDCEELTSLFIAICRAAGIPARTVWVEGHCYPEFYLVDSEGKGHWLPCQAAGSPAFGGIPELRPILQKGDNFRPPWNTRIAQRYLAEYVTGNNLAGKSGQPKVEFIRKPVPN